MSGLQYLYSCVRRQGGREDGQVGDRGDGQAGAAEGGRRHIEGGSRRRVVTDNAAEAMIKKGM